MTLTFTVAVSPVAKPMQSLSLDNNALTEAEVHRIVKESLLNPKYEFVWKPAHYCVMMNPNLKAEYEGKTPTTTEHISIFIFPGGARGRVVKAFI